MRYPRQNKKRWVCYPSEYKYDGTYKLVYSNFQMKKLLYRWGVGAEAFPQYLIRGKFKSGGKWIKDISFWNIPRDHYGIENIG